MRENRISPVPPAVDVKTKAVSPLLADKKDLMEDAELIRKCVRGDKEAWNYFVDNYSRLIHSYIYATFRRNARQLPGGGKLEDIFQEVFLSLVRDNCRKLRSFRGKNGCSFASWLRQVVINLTLDYMRKERLIASRMRSLPDSRVLNGILNKQGFSVSADKTVIQEESLKLSECIQMLATDEKYFLEMHVHAGLTLEELREYFKMSRGAIDMRKARIVDRLRECFRSKGLLL